MGKNCIKILEFALKNGNCSDTEKYAQQAYDFYEKNSRCDKWRLKCYIYLASDYHEKKDQRCERVCKKFMEFWDKSGEKNVEYFHQILDYVPDIMKDDIILKHYPIYLSKLAENKEQNKYRLVIRTYDLAELQFRNDLSTEALSHAKSGHEIIKSS